MIPRGFAGVHNLKELAENSKVLDKGKGYLLLPLEDVVSKEQVRKRFEGIEELAETIRNDQLQSPIHVAPKNAEGKYVILRGERRWRACKLLGLKEIKAVIDDTEYSPEKMIYAEMIENVQRENLDAIEIAMAIKRLSEEFGASQAEIAETLGKSRSFVSMHFSVAENLPSQAESLFKDGFTMGAETLYLLGQLNKHSSEAVTEVCDAARNEGRGVTRNEARDLLKAYTESAKAETEPATSKEQQTQPASPQVVHYEEEQDELFADEPADAPVEESLAGETIEQQNEASVATSEQGRPAQEKPTKPKPSPVAIEVKVSVRVEDSFEIGTIVWSRKAPRDGYVFVTLQDGTVRSFALADLQLIDVRNLEEGVAGDSE